MRARLIALSGSVSPVLAWNVVGVLGLLGFVIGLGGVVGSWWVSLMVGGLLAVGLSYIASTHLAPASELASPRSAAGSARADLKTAA